MPAPEEVHAGLLSLAQAHVPLALAWHLVLLAALVALALRWRPSIRLAAVLLAALPASVAIVAWRGGNPFNGIVMSILAAGVACGVPWQPAQRFELTESRLARLAGVLTLAFGLAYPHFVASPVWVHVLEAPVGVLPCPSLAVAVGLALLFRESPRSLALPFAAAGAFYGLFGAFVIGVRVDLALAAAAGLLAIRTGSAPSRATAAS